MSGDNLQALEDSPIDTYIATDKGEKKNKVSLDNTERKLVKADFDYDEASDTFTCPGQQKLVVVSQGKDGNRTYQGDIEKCNACPYKSRCCQSNKGEARTINTDDTLMTQRGQVPVRQAKLVISCKVKVLVWISQRNGFVRFNPPPVSSVASPAERC